MATQNPIETEGTYPLPEAQVDRFMMKVLVDYPTDEEEFVIVERVIGTPATGVGGGLHRPVGRDATGMPASVYVDPSLIQYAVKLVGATRRPAEHGLKEMAGLPDLWRQPARQHLDDRGRARTGLPARPRLRAAGGRDRPGRTTALRHRLVFSPTRP